MSEASESEFRQRMRNFEARTMGDRLSASIKIRVSAGCFHREHSPNAYALIDRHFAAIPPSERGFDLLEHESGPEILVFVALATAGVSLATSVLNLVTAIIQARRAGVEAGDRPNESLELIVRRESHEGSLREEVVLRIDHMRPIDPSEIEERLSAALERIANDDTRSGRSSEDD